MLKVENRESAHLRSRVKDLSVVPNVASFNGLFAAITPIAKAAKNAEGLYEPILVRDNETLIANFGDPRTDPEKYIDLYSIMQLVGNGGTCYVSKVDSGNAGVYQFPFLADPIRKDDTPETADTLVLMPDKSDPNTYSAIVQNKYVVTGLKGYKADGASSFVFYSLPFAVIGGSGEIEDSNSELESAEGIPTGESVDFSGKYSWKCVQRSDGEFDIIVTLSEEPPAGVTKFVAFGNVDPAWGSEPLVFERVSSKDDEDNKVTLITYESTGSVDNEYVISKLDKGTGSPGDIKWSPVEPNNKLFDESTYDTELSNKKLKLIFTVPYVDGKPNDAAIKAAIGTNSEPSDPGMPYLKATVATRKSHSMIAYSSMADELTFDIKLSQAKPYSIHAYYLTVEVSNNGGSNVLGSVKVKLDGTTTNQGIVNEFNSALGTVVRFELMDPSTASACGLKEHGANSIAQALLDTYCDGGTKQKMSPNPQELLQPITIEQPSFQVDVNDYINALMQYKAKKYVGCLMADMVCLVTNDIDESTGKVNTTKHDLYPLNSSDRRTLHYNMKDIAFERKDTTVILSTPYTPGYDNLTAFTIDDACNWVASQGAYADLWEYGQGATTDYATQSFYLEIYYSWLEMQCNWVTNGEAKQKTVKVAPANLVVNNILQSWRERGVQYPVAGDQGGILPETCTILMNPKTKLERDQLVQYRINPIWDTGTRGIQIFGNETLNAGYTDLNAAHIARTLVYIRSRIDEYTETLKFSINNLLLWDKWKTYVTQYILEPLVAVNAISEYRVAMGEDTTSSEEIANRTINGIVQLIFYQSAEVFDLTYTVYSSSTTIDEATANT